MATGLGSGRRPSAFDWLFPQSYRPGLASGIDSVIGAAMAGPA